MNQKYQRGAVRASVLINVLLGIGIIGAVVFLLFSNTQKTAQEQPLAAKTPAQVTPTAPPSPDEGQIEQLKSNLEIETLKLERLRIQTERVRAEQRRTQSVTPDTVPVVDQADTAGLDNDNPG